MDFEMDWQMEKEKQMARLKLMVIGMEKRMG